MNEFEELNSWYETAEHLLSSLDQDKLKNIMVIALCLRDSYVNGKKDGVKEWNEEAR